MRNNCLQVVVENFFEPGILYLLMKKPSYGYEIQKDLKESCICEVNIGNLYRCLSRMKKQGYVTSLVIKSKIGPNKLSYSITNKGKIYLNSWVESLKKQNKIISSLIKNYQKLV